MDRYTALDVRTSSRPLGVAGRIGKRTPTGWTRSSVRPSTPADASCSVGEAEARARAVVIYGAKLDS